MPKGNRLIALSACVAGLCLAGASAWAGEIRSVAVQAGSTGTRAEIQLAGGGSYKTLSLAGPNRLVVDFPDSTAVRGLKLPAAAGVVTAVRTGTPAPGTFRVVFDLAESVAAFKPQLQGQGAESRLLIEWPGEAKVASVQPTPAAVPVAAGPTAQPGGAEARREAARATAALTAAVVQQASAAPAPAPVTSTPAPTTTAVAATNTPSPAAILNGQATVPVVVASAPAPTPAPAPAPADEQPAPRPVMPSDASRIRMQAGMRTLVVAIDPGHGGQDPGAIGPTGKREKDVTLAVARELARQVNATPGLRAYLTRDTDVFIPLPQRAQRARAAKADIFISIHADAAENRAATGSSVYVLSTKGASSQRARWLADKENAADLIGGVSLQRTEGTLANVLLDLAQSGNMKASEDAASHVLGGLKRIGNNHKPNLERANFAVLRTSDMPAMLVETAFISNPDEERRLTDPAYQRRVAGAVLDGVHTYFSRQPPPGTLFAARAQAEMEAAAGTVAGGSK
ncbi:N-acetylmuramoyl-L-alanine amidase [Stenotrophomonas acidaminiphila]|jgi:N-acetylmuramoyl-L-alanine amidase|uniref:N-acetylmuramoyl-L-alanine amidase n=1 Tax=Stenotrophomonas acidaminiphila TaxID=128780 RepID=UPI000BDD76E1|nr:N-acetylmuramoyl-L-alanine amidase [Stenotrophomonas acidaminiphila]OZB52392.1 MAG: N-acetylmuramoyl-L-alanine amidase [Stenotrophomonas sp. 14-69-23]WHL20288.1 N-acetylmuramoyl-L-alanine amidase [Stenotrophomonas acidaminiphila]